MKKINVVFGFAILMVLSACYKDEVVQLKQVGKPAEKIAPTNTNSVTPPAALIAAANVEEQAKAVEKAKTPEQINATAVLLKKAKIETEQKRVEKLKIQAQKEVEAEIEKLSAHIFYIKDKMGLCYAVLPNAIFVNREQSIASFANVLCEKVGLSEKK